MMLMKKKNEKGFTLIELVIVVAVLAIIAGIAIPSIGNITNNAREEVDEVNVVLFNSAIKFYYAENGSYPEDAAGAGNAIIKYTELTAVPAPERSGYHFYYHETSQHDVICSNDPGDGYVQIDGVTP